MKGPIARCNARGEKEGHRYTAIILVTAILTTIVVIMVAEFCGGPWFCPLSRDLFSPRVLFFVCFWCFCFFPFHSLFSVVTLFGLMKLEVEMQLTGAGA